MLAFRVDAERLEKVRSFGIHAGWLEYSERGLQFVKKEEIPNCPLVEKVTCLETGKVKVRVKKCASTAKDNRKSLSVESAKKELLEEE